MAVVGYHRASRSAGATWMRIVLSLTLIAPLSVIAHPARAANSIDVALLKDLNPGNLSNSTLYDGPLKVDTGAYYFTSDVEAAWGVGLFESNGTVGSATRRTDFGDTMRNPSNLVAHPMGFVFFTADATGSSCTAGLWFAQPANSAQRWTGYGQPIHVGGTTYFGGRFCDVQDLSVTADGHVVFAAWYTDGAGFTSDFLPWSISYDESAYTWVTEDITKGFAYDTDTGNMVSTDEIFAVVGNVVYASLLDCNPVATPSSTCTEGKTYDELYKLDLGAVSPTWALVKDLSTGNLGTQFSRVVGIAGGRLYFEAKPDGGSYSIYTTNGTSAGTVPVYSGQAFSLAEATALGDYLYFVPDAARTTLRRASTGSSESVQTCDFDIFEQEVLGSTLYFPCGVAAAVDGLELWKTTEAAASASVVYDLTPSTGVGLEPSYLRAFEGALYFSGTTHPSLSRELFRYSGYSADDPELFVLPGAYDHEVKDVVAASDRLFFWSKSSGEGLEPWIGTPKTARTLTVAPSGSGTVGSSPGGIGACASASGDCTEDYADGTSVTLTASPGAGLTVSWASGCTPDGTDPNKCVASMTAARTVDVRFGYQLDVTTSGVGTVASVKSGISDCGGTAPLTPDCSGIFGSGTTVRLEAVPDTGLSTKWSSNCTPVVSFPNKCDVLINAAKTVTATFGYKLTLNLTGTGSGAVTSDTGGINCSRASSAMTGTCWTVLADTGVAGSTTLVLTAAPTDVSNVFDGWSGTDGAGCSGLTCTVLLTADRSVTGSFSPAATGPWDLTVSKGGGGKGTVTSSTGFTCRGTCPSSSTLDIPDGTTVTLTAKAASGSSFVEWQNIDCEEAQTSLICTFDIGADETDVIARFEPKQTVSVLRSGAGAGSTVVTSSPSGIACGATCSATFGLGAEVVLTAALASGSNVTSWTGVVCDEGESNTTDVCTFTVEGPTQVVVTTTAPSATQYTLSLTNRTAYAITSSTGGIDCGLVCQWPFPAGAVTLSITMPQAYRPVTSGLTWTAGTPSGGFITYTASVTFTTSDLSYTIRRARA